MYDYDYYDDEDWSEEEYQDYDDEGWSEEEYQDYESIWDSIRPWEVSKEYFEKCSSKFQFDN